MAVFWAAARVIVGFVFLWSFLDKLFGLGFSATAGWLDGRSPTSGFLQHGASNGPGVFFRDLTGGGGGWLDWVFMITMAAVGLGLVLGIMTRLAALGGIVWMGLFYLSTYAPTDNPVVDIHVVVVLVLVGIMLSGAGRAYGLGRWWESRWTSGRAPWLLGG
ncbi:DoxX family membrane protein [Nakamurella sp. YIM 132087]|uniref:DoxX family membrane protein n=1 Tax=Nakamurella alba TaxID=2665158 RepID=A0A7K1FIX1_9ACTN|nr:DoxX family membrane protein [Nakamurella alba]MTD13399.1 DoxX family membrane protein [Nakamurella alba]